MMTEPMTGLYALTVFAAFIFFSWEERRDGENSDDVDFILVAISSLVWPVLVAVCIGSSYYGTGGNNSASYWFCTPVGKNQVKIETKNCSGTFFLNVTGY